MNDTNRLRFLIGKRVHDFRVTNNYTQAQFAETMDISVNFLSEIENGKKGMSQETLYRLCTSYKISADYILFGNEKNIIKETSQNPQQLIEIASSLNMEELNMVIDYLNSLKKIRNI